MFTQTQLEIIRKIAKLKKNQGELAVWKAIEVSVPNAFDEKQLNIIKYCAEECKRQRSGEMSVYDMINAWNEAQQTWTLSHLVPKWNITIQFIERIGQLVEPNDNRKGFRTVPVGVMDNGIWHEKEHWRDVPYMLEVTIEAYYYGMMSPDYPSIVPNKEPGKTAEDQFYYEYENIHPFVDGNGRSGKILYNYLCGTLENPIMPPNFWGGSNP